MSYTRTVVTASTAAVLILVLASAASAQVCLGIPADEGDIAFEGEVLADGAITGYGGRLGMNFNTEYAFEIGLRRPRLDAGTGLTLSGLIGYEMREYEPPVCFTIGVHHERRPVPDAEDETETMIPIGLGIGKRLGSASGLSLALFVRPEYLVRVKPDPVGEFETFWDELGARSEGRGAIGLLAATPFLYATGRVEITTRDYRPTLAVGLGVIF